MCCERSYIMSSVNVDPQLRKRLKKLAALKDVTQATVIKEALDLLEAKLKENKNDKLKHPGEEILDNYFKSINLEDWEIEIMDNLGLEEGIDIEDLRMEFREFS